MDCHYLRREIGVYGRSQRPLRFVVAHFHVLAFRFGLLVGFLLGVRTSILLWSLSRNPTLSHSLSLWLSFTHTHARTHTKTKIRRCVVLLSLFMSHSEWWQRIDFIQSHSQTTQSPTSSKTHETKSFRSTRARVRVRATKNNSNVKKHKFY